jgi:hypothetical protein
MSSSTYLVSVNVPFGCQLLPLQTIRSDVAIMEGRK